MSKDTNIVQSLWNVLFTSFNNVCAYVLYGGRAKVEILLKLYDQLFNLNEEQPN